MQHAQAHVDVGVEMETDKPSQYHSLFAVLRWLKVLMLLKCFPDRHFIFIIVLSFIATPE